MHEFKYLQIIKSVEKTLYFWLYMLCGFTICLSPFFLLSIIIIDSIAKVIFILYIILAICTLLCFCILWLIDTIF